ncbi:hypothetical protein MIND_01328000 [Mycena indigotica]|uniref:BTB domain-containing protein n=1 Tax=Mycena indigotica TaxID=2126181 RepID=A0A8H6VU34_9AGAR|nr:uncharacterized protein MIND_01328000 [Mycena indigotica]KAF7290148.1 hypothetical protein MIND_01328000 [Mycena indigotica]
MAKSQSTSTRTCSQVPTGLVEVLHDELLSLTLPLDPSLPPVTPGWSIGAWSRRPQKRFRKQLLGPTLPVLKITIGFEAANAFIPSHPLTIETRLPFSAEPLPARIRACLVDTIDGGDLIDVKFWLYSRVGNGHVYHPRPLYGNLKLLRGTSKQFHEDLDHLLSGFAESSQTDIATDNPPPVAFEEYDYMSDSDLDNDEEVEGDIRVDDKADASAAAEPDSEPEPLAGTSTLSTQLDIQNTPGRRGYRIVIKGHAYNTWKALLYYLYTGQIHFRKIKAGIRQTPAVQREEGAPECSPKSMYKLADKHGLETIKARALESIRSQMSVDNIVHEVFSNFTAMFDEIKTMQVAFLRDHLHDPVVRDGLTGMLLHLCAGRGSSASAAVLQAVIFGPNIL